MRTREEIENKISELKKELDLFRKKGMRTIILLFHTPGKNLRLQAEQLQRFCFLFFTLA